MVYVDTCDVGPVGQNNHILQPPHSAVAAGSLGRRLKDLVLILNVCLFVYLFVCLSVCLFVCC